MALIGNDYDEIGFKKMDYIIVIPSMILQFISLCFNLKVYNFGNKQKYEPISDKSDVEWSLH